MDRKMTHTAQAELTNSIRRRYRATVRNANRKVLDESIAITGYKEKSAIRMLNAVQITGHRQTRNRPSLYDEAARAALVVLWEASDCICGKRRSVLVPILLPALERNGQLKLDAPSARIA